MPSDVLSEEKMLSIMIDMHIAEEVLQTKNIHFDSSRVLFHSVYKSSILKKYNVDLATFDSSFVYYERNVEHMDKLYQRVIDSLAFRYSINKIE